MRRGPAHGRSSGPGNAAGEPTLNPILLESMSCRELPAQLEDTGLGTGALTCRFGRIHRPGGMHHPERLLVVPAAALAKDRRILDVALETNAAAGRARLQI